MEGDLPVGTGEQGPQVGTGKRDPVGWYSPSLSLSYAGWRHPSSSTSLTQGTRGDILGKSGVTYCPLTDLLIETFQPAGGLLQLPLCFLQETKKGLTLVPKLDSTQDWKEPRNPELEGLKWRPSPAQPRHRFPYF